jgi:uncharacterized protein (TIGR02145 family)
MKNKISLLIGLFSTVVIYAQNWQEIDRLTEKVNQLSQSKLDLERQKNADLAVIEEQKQVHLSQIKSHETAIQAKEKTINELNQQIKQYQATPMRLAFYELVQKETLVNGAKDNKKATKLIEQFREENQVAANQALFILDKGNLIICLLESDGKINEFRHVEMSEKSKKKFLTSLEKGDFVRLTDPFYTLKQLTGIDSRFFQLNISLTKNQEELKDLQELRAISSTNLAQSNEKWVKTNKQWNERIALTNKQQEEVKKDLRRLIEDVNAIIIGNQIWMTKNLNVDKFRNGDPIPEAKTDEEWENAGEDKQPAWCYYNNDPANGEKFGKLYNWYAVNDPRGLAPEGWHIPSDAEWTQLTGYLGGESVAGTKMKSSSDWGKDGNGTNESGFSGLPGGYRGFNDFGLYGYWWSSTESGTNYAWYRYLVYGNGSVSRTNFGKEGGFSVRCLRD